MLTTQSTKLEGQMGHTTQGVIEQFEALNQRLTSLCAGITLEDAERPAWTEGLYPKDPQNSKETLEVRQVIVKHLRQVWHDEEKPQRLPGLVACSSDTIVRLHALNAEKARFEQLIVSIRKTHNAPTAKLTQLLGTADGKRSEEVQALLAVAGMQGLNLTLCYRRFQQLPAATKSVSWTWSRSSRSIKTLTIEEAAALAHHKLARNNRLQSALDQLKRLPPDAPLAVVRPVQPALKANIVFTDYEGRTVRKLITAHSPLLYLDDGGPLPRKTWPGFEDTAPARLHRHRRYLAPKPYIKALNLYRYLESPGDT